MKIIVTSKKSVKIVVIRVLVVLIPNTVNRISGSNNDISILLYTKEFTESRIDSCVVAAGFWQRENYIAHVLTLGISDFGKTVGFVTGMY